MQELLQKDLKWLQNTFRLEDFKTLAILAFCTKVALFEFLREERKVEEVAKQFKIDLKVAEALLQFLRSKGLVEGEERFKATEISKILFSRDSHFSLLELIEEKLIEIRNWLDLGKMFSGNVRKEGDFFKNRTIFIGKLSLLGDLKVVNRIAELDEFRKAKKLLDLGGGHGLYSYAFTLLNKDLKAYVFDLPEVVEVAREFMANLNAERVEFIAGDFFKDDIGKDYDIVFSSFNPGGKRVELISKIYNALNSEGIYANRQFFPSEGFEIRDIEWNLWSFEKLKKHLKAFSFEGDLTLESYVSELKKSGFKILGISKDDWVLILAKKP